MIYPAVGSALNPLNNWEQKKIEFLILFQVEHMTRKAKWPAFRLLKYIINLQQSFHVFGTEKFQRGAVNKAGSFIIVYGGLLQLQTDLEKNSS